MTCHAAKHATINTRAMQSNQYDIPPRNTAAGAACHYVDVATVNHVLNLIISIDITNLSGITESLLIMDSQSDHSS